MSLKPNVKIIFLLKAHTFLSNTLNAHMALIYQSLYSIFVRMTYLYKLSNFSSLALCDMKSHVNFN